MSVNISRFSVSASNFLIAFKVNKRNFQWVEDRGSGSGGGGRTNKQTKKRKSFAKMFRPQSCQRRFRLSTNCSLDQTNAGLELKPDHHDGAGRNCMKRFKPLSTVMSSAVNTYLQDQEKNTRERPESNPWLLGEKQECYLCATPSVFMLFCDPIWILRTFF